MNIDTYQTTSGSNVLGLAGFLPTEKSAKQWLDMAIPYLTAKERKAGYFIRITDLDTILNRTHDKLEDFDGDVGEALINSEIVHFDENGMRVNKKLSRNPLYSFIGPVLMVSAHG